MIGLLAIYFILYHKLSIFFTFQIHKEWMIDMSGDIDEGNTTFDYIFIYLFENF